MCLLLLLVLLLLLLLVVVTVDRVVVDGAVVECVVWFSQCGYFHIFHIFLFFFLLLLNTCSFSFHTTTKKERGVSYYY